MASNAPFSIDASMTMAFKALEDIPVEEESVEEHLKDGKYKAVVIGGGTGAPVSIRTLLSLGIDTSAVVAMADDGGSTGILREAADVTPPGDVRKCIAAFAADPYDPLVRAFKYRIEIADGHALGNLMLAALEDACGSFTDAIAICERLLHAQGHVYPSTLEHVTLSAVTKDGQVLDGQAVACHSQTALSRVELHGPEPYVTANKAAIRAIMEADLIVLGPGSLFTSIIPNILVPGILEALRQSKAAKVFVCSVADTQGETWGLEVREHVEALCDHGMEDMLDYVFVQSSRKLKEDTAMSISFSAIAGRNALSDPDEDESHAHLKGLRPLEASRADVDAIKKRGATPVLRDFADAEHPTWHSPEVLRDALIHVIRLSQSKNRRS